MKRSRLLLPAVIALAASVLSPLAPAQVSAPAFIDYQGRLTDVNGNPLGGANGFNYTLQFRIYDSEDGADPIWAEEQTVTVIDGAFSVRLGEGIQITGANRPPLENVFDGPTRYLGVTVVGQGGEINPRLAFLSTPYSFVSRKAAVAESLNQTNGVAQTSHLSVGGNLTTVDLRASNSIQLEGNRPLEFGYGIPNKEANAGRIGYGTFTPGALDIVGAGTNGNNRRVKIWSEGGLDIAGPVSVSSVLTANFVGALGYECSGGSINFGASRRQMLNLWHGLYGIGIQDNTLYNRSDNNFAWYIKGQHADSAYNAGGGRHIASLDSTGLWVGDRLGGYTNDTGLYVRGMRGIRIEAIAPGFWMMYHDESIGSPGHADFRLRHSLNSVNEFFYWNSQGNAGRASDRSLKKDIEPLRPILNKVLALTPVSFRYKSSGDDTPKVYGFIAQEVKPHFPDLVTGVEGSYGLSESSLPAVAIAAVQEEHAERKAADDELKAEIDRLKAENAALLKRLEALEKHLSIK